MAYRPIPIQLFIRYLKSLGLVPNSKMKGSHQKWNYPKGKQQLRRSIVIRPSKDRDVPAHHIRSCAMDLGKSMDQVYAEILAL